MTEASKRTLLASPCIPWLSGAGEPGLRTPGWPWRAELALCSLLRARQKLWALLSVSGPLLGGSPLQKAWEISM